MAAKTVHTVMTSFWPKPIPVRFYDWEAVLDDYEAGHPIGFGATEADAITDLKAQIEENEPLTDEQATVPYGHAMLPNDKHPGPGCSCRDCQREYP